MTLTAEQLRLLEGLCRAYDANAAEHNDEASVRVTIMLNREIDGVKAVTGVIVGIEPAGDDWMITMIRAAMRQRGFRVLLSDVDVTGTQERNGW